MGTQKPVGLGLIGCGAFGAFCLETFTKLPGVRVAAAADVREELAQQIGRTYGVPALHNPDDLIAREDVDLVHVATPPSTHHELVMAAVKAGKHCLCEKPLAVSVAQGDQMLAAAAEAGVIVPVNFVLRHNPITDAVKAIIDSGLLGDVVSARLTNCAGDTPLGKDHWFWDKDVSGGIFIEHGVHFFDLYSYWLGQGEMLFAHTELREGTTQEDRVTCAVRHAGGAVASHYHGFDQMTLMDRTDHRLVLEQGDIRVDGWIPLSLTVNAAVDDEGMAGLTEICRGGAVETIAGYDGDLGSTTGRGKQRHVTQRIRLNYCPQPDKQVLYANSVGELLADQIAFVRDPAHQRRVTEENGLDALALAETAANLAAEMAD